MQKLPKILAREPLVDAVFEVRLGGDPQIADLLPGVLFNEFRPKPKLHRLPAAEIPRPIRANDQNMVFSPVVRLELEEFTISFGDRNVVVGCKIPYPKWPRFKTEILKIVNLIAEVGIPGPVERYSLKYVNLIPAPTISSQISKIDMSVRVGDFEVTDDHISIQVHRKESDTMHIMSIVTAAHARLVGQKQIFGAVVDIDSIRAVHFSDFGAFAKALEPEIESLRKENKAKFFSCLKEATIQEMGPEYD